MRFILLSLVLTSCAVSARVPFVSTGVDFEPSQGESYAVAEPAPAASSESPFTAGTRGPALACVSDPAGATLMSPAPIGAGVQLGCVETERDVYVLTAPPQARAGALYTMRLVADHQICAAIYDQDRERMGVACANDDEPRAFWAAVAPGTRLYIGLERSLSYKSPYALEIEERLLDDADEPNNGISHAVALDLGVEHNALMQRVLNDPALGADIYAVDAPGGRLSIVVDPGSGDAEAEVAVFDADRRRIDSFESKNPGAIARGEVSVKRGRYFVKVTESRSTVPAADADTTANTKPSDHYFKPYQIRVDSTPRVSRR